MTGRLAFFDGGDLCAEHTDICRYRCWKRIPDLSR